MNTETRNGGWIGPRLSKLEIVAVMFVGIAGIMIAGLQPLLLGTLSHEGKITANQLGQAATAELLTLGLAAFLRLAALLRGLLPRRVLLGLAHAVQFGLGRALQFHAVSIAESGEPE